MAQSYSRRKKYLAELCVSSFIKIFCGIQDAPSELIHLCVAMYFQLFDVWDIEASPEKNFQFNDLATIITRLEDNKKWCNSFGSIETQKGDITIWRFKILYDSPDAILGVVSDDCKEKLDKYSVEEAPLFCNIAGSYTFYTCTGEKMCAESIDDYHFGECVENDTIEMKLDMTDNDEKYAKLSYKVNNNDCGVAFAEIDINKTYTMAIAMYDPGKVQILH